MKEVGARWQEIVPGLFLVGGSAVTSSDDCLVYAVDGRTETCLIDCGAGRSVPAMLTNLEEAGLGGRPLTVILTHCHVDHIGGLSGLRRRGPLRAICHRDDAEAIRTGDPHRTASSWYGIRLPRVEVDQVVEGEEETVVVGEARLRCVHAPGHTPGSLAVVWESPSAGRVLFGQDIHGPFLPEFGSDLNEWAASMRKLLALEADLLCEGHYGQFRPAEAVRRFIREQMEEQGFLE